MPIQFDCHCGKSYQVEDSLAGRTARCKVCRRVMRIPVFIPAVPIDLHPGRGKKKSGIGRTLVISIVSTGLLMWLALWWGDRSRLPGPIRMAEKEPVTEYVIPLIKIVLFWIAPLVLPANLSRRGFLSVGRWMCASALCFVISSFFFAMAASGGGERLDRDYFTGAGLTSFFGIIGCLLAATIHPKESPKP